MTAAGRPVRRVSPIERVDLSAHAPALQAIADDFLLQINARLALIQSQLERIEGAIPNGDLAAQVQLVIIGQAQILDALAKRPR
jgi:hypothetical protein